MTEGKGISYWLDKEQQQVETSQELVTKKCKSESIPHPSELE
jgi:hypothetical protein